MHKSRLATIVIDSTTESADRSQAFWAAALGKPVVARDERFAGFRGRIGGSGGVYVGHQKDAEGAPAIHLDIETDDVGAEVRRLVELGATEKKRVRNHVVLVAPGGHEFCVVPTRRGDFEESATSWR